MNGGLWDKPIRHWKAKDTRNKSGTAKQKEVPVKPGRFLEGEMAGLCGKTTNVLK